MLRHALMIAAVAALAGCQRSPQSEVAEEREELQETRTEAQQEIAEERQDVAEARQQQEQELQPGETANVQGKVAQVSEESVEIETQQGEDLNLKFGENPMTPQGQPFQITQLQEGAEVRASYTEMDGEKIIKTIEVTGQEQQQEQPGAGEQMKQQGQEMEQEMQQ